MTAAGPGGAAGLPITGLVLVATATVAGAWLARQHRGQRQMWFGAAAGALLVIAVLHMLPDAWTGARDAGVPTWLVPCVAVASFAANAAISRVGCTCRADEEHAGGTGSAAALAVHRFLEGAALALSGAVAAVALALHAVGEGLAVGALLSGRPRALATWLAVMCSAPAVGAVTADAVPAVQVAEPLLMAVATGVLAQAARVSFRAALLRRPAGRHLTTAPVAAAAVSASLTALAVYGVG